MKSIAVFGATGGLGGAIVDAIRARGPLCLGYAKNRARADEMVSALGARGHEAIAAPVDIRDGEAVAAFLARAAACGDGLGAIIVATGPALPLMPMAAVSDTDFDRVFATDVRGAFNVLKHGSALLRDGGGGAIVLTLTTAVLRTLEHDGMSGAPKTAVGALVRQFAREVGPYNVRCNGVAPAVIDAGIVYAPEFADNAMAQGVIESMIAGTPLGRMGRPEEVAAVYDFLLSDGAGYINGQIIGVDGGFSA